MRLARLHSKIIKAAEFLRSLGLGHLVEDYIKNPRAFGKAEKALRLAKGLCAAKHACYYGQTLPFPEAAFGLYGLVEVDGRIVSFVGDTVVGRTGSFAQMTTTNSPDRALRQIEEKTFLNKAQHEVLLRLLAEDVAAHEYWGRGAGLQWGTPVLKKIGLFLGAPSALPKAA